ncbi:MAG: DUF4845 domain-containing protein [Gammaproteobacteria bacterium]
MRLAIAGLFATVLIKLVPVYIQGYSIGSALEGMAQDSAMRGKSPLELKKYVMRRLDINMIYDVHEDDVGVTRSGDGYDIEIDYEPQIRFIGNLYFVAIFDKSVHISAK